MQTKPNEIVPCVEMNKF